MKAYADALVAEGKTVIYWDFDSTEPELFFSSTQQAVTIYNVVDDYLEKAIHSLSKTVKVLDSSNFL